MRVASCFWITNRGCSEAATRAFPVGSAVFEKSRFFRSVASSLEATAPLTRRMVRLLKRWASLQVLWPSRLLLLNAGASPQRLLQIDWHAMLLEQIREGFLREFPQRGHPVPAELRQRGHRLVVESNQFTHRVDCTVVRYDRLTSPPSEISPSIAQPSPFSWARPWLRAYRYQYLAATFRSDLQRAC